MDGTRACYEFEFFRENRWLKVPQECVGEGGFLYRTEGAVYQCRITKGEKPGISAYTMGFAADYPTQLRFRITVPGEKEYFHLIPCNIYGDNNEKGIMPEMLPVLTRRRGSGVPAGAFPICGGSREGGHVSGCGFGGEDH